MSEKGFTLIELICTLAIFAIVMSTSLPYAVKLGDARFEMAQRMLISDIRYCQQLSDYTNTSHRIIFSDRSYSINRGVYVIKTVSLPYGVKLRVISGSNTIEFDGNGTPKGVYGAGCTLELLYKDRIAVLTIRPVTGRVMIK